MTAFLEIQLPYRFKDLPDLFEGRDPSKVTRLVITHSTYAEDDPDHLGPRESFGLPDLPKLTSLDLNRCTELVSLPSNIGTFSHLSLLNCSGCSLLSLSRSLKSLRHLTSLNLERCTFNALPFALSLLFQLTELNLSNCCNLECLPDWIGNLCHLTTLNLSNRTSEFFVSLPESIGNLSNLTSLDLRGSDNLTSIPTSLHSLSHLKTPLLIAGSLPIPPDMDWSEFKREVTVKSYMEYMMRINKISSILSGLLEYMKRFDSKDYLFRGYDISSIYGLIERKEGRGNDLIGYLCLMLTNDWKMKREWICE